jgi:hypothetical protein
MPITALVNTKTAEVATITETIINPTATTTMSRLIAQNRIIILNLKEQAQTIMVEKLLLIMRIKMIKKMDNKLHMIMTMDGITITTDE